MKNKESGYGKTWFFKGDKRFESDSTFEYDNAGGEMPESIHQKYNLPPIGETLPAGTLAMQESLGTIYTQWDNFINTLIEDVDGYDFSVVSSPRPGLDYFRKAAAKELKEDAAKAFTQNPDIQPSEKKMLPRIVDRIARLFKSSRPALDDDTQNDTPDNNPQNTSQGDAEMLTWTQNNVIDDTPKNINALTIIKRFEECMGPDIHAYTPHKLAQFMKGLHTEKIAGEVLETIDFKYTAKTNYGLKKSLPPTQKPALQSEPSTAHLKNIIDAKLFRYITKWYEEVR